ncbi:hypothetical protein Rhein_3088 [Rheinheimera sp. A13L]|nr:hypothetical protein Rhein_3088 [Rheinheimera sp. A13L]
MLSREFWQTFVQLLSFNGYILPEELHHYPTEDKKSDQQP